VWLHRATIPVGALGERIRRRRERLGLTQCRLGTLSGVGPAEVRTVEAGCHARVASVDAILIALEVVADEIDHA
jgi:transcriptional regulator with XRE-family HTH domain